MTNTYLRIKEKIEVNPVDENRNYQNEFVPTEKSSLAPLEEESEQRQEDYSLLGNRYFKQSRIEVIPRKPPKRSVMMIHSELPCHVKISPRLPHSFLVFN